MRTVAGLDLCNDVSQISILTKTQDGKKEVVTRPVVLGTEKYCIPTCAMRMNDREEWLYGMEAERTPKEFGRMFYNLIDLACENESVLIEGEEYETVTILSNYIRSVLKGITFKSEWPEKPLLFITMRRLDPKVLRVARKAVEARQLALHDAEEE